MTLTQFALGMGALAFAVFGVMLLINPPAMRTVGILADNPEARTEIRAMYGGLELGVAAFLALSIWRAEWSRPALLLQLLAIGSLAAARLLAIGIERGRVRGIIWFFAALEFVAAALTGWALLTV